MRHSLFVWFGFLFWLFQRSGWSVDSSSSELCLSSKPLRLSGSSGWVPGPSAILAFSRQSPHYNFISTFYLFNVLRLALDSLRFAKNNPELLISYLYLLSPGIINMHHHAQFMLSLGAEPRALWMLRSSYQLCYSPSSTT